MVLVPYTLDKKELSTTQANALVSIRWLESCERHLFPFPPYFFQEEENKGEAREGAREGECEEGNEENQEEMKEEGNGSREPPERKLG